MAKKDSGADSSYKVTGPGNNFSNLESSLEQVERLALLGCWELDLTTLVPKWSDGYFRILGYPVEHGTETYAMWKARVHPEDIGRMEKLIQDNASLGKRISADYRIVLPDGSVRYIHDDTDVPVKDGSGRAVRYMGVVQDVTELRCAEKIQDETEQKLKCFIERTPDGVTLIDESGRIVVWNRGEELISGIKSADVIGRYIWDIQFMMGLDHEKNPAHYERIKAFILEMLKTGSSPMLDKFHEREILRPDGAYRTIQALTFPVRTSKGYILGSISRDITELKQAAKMLQESEGRYRTMVETAIEGIWISDTGGRTTFVNRRMAEMIGYSPEEMIRKSAYDFMDEEARSMGCQNFKRRLDGISERFEQKYLRKDGTTMWALVSATPLYDGAGQITAFMGMLSDITERRLAEEALQESQSMLETMFMTIPDAIVLYDTAGRVVKANDAALRAYGFKTPGVTREEAVKRLKISHMDHRDVSVDELPTTRALHGQIVAGEEYRFTDALGRRLVITTYAAPLFKDGQVNGAVALWHDITELESARESLKLAKDQAELYLDLMGHDINNMHQIAIGYLELTRDLAEVDEGSRLAIEKPLETLQRSSKLIDNVRKLQKVQEGGLMESAVDLEDMLRHVIEEYQDAAGGHISHSNDKASHFVLANELLYDALSNLIGNAIKHSGGNEVNIKVGLDQICETGKSYCRVSVEDNGPGIPDDSKRQIFFRLQRGQTKARGIGLGLYLVKSLVESYHGRVWVEDRVPGDFTKGARFVLLIPAFTT